METKKTYQELLAELNQIRKDQKLPHDFMTINEWLEYCTLNASKKAYILFQIEQALNT